MAANPSQRSRRPQTQQAQPQGVMLNHPARETSPSPPGSISQRPRAAKTQSMPLVPSLTSFPGPNAQQASPTIRRSSPSLGPGQVARLLPTPPHPNPGAFVTDDQQIAAPPGPQQHQPHYARPPPIRAPTAAYPNKFQELESQMTPEFFADIDRAAEQQQAQYHYNIQPQPQSQSHSYVREESPSPGGKASIVDRTRGAPPERSSPLNPAALAQRVGGQQQQQNHARESPKARDRQPASPSTAPFSQSQAQTHTPEVQQQQHSPPSIMTGGEPHPASYLAQYNARESPTIRRAPNSEPRMSIVPIANQSQSTPPLQTMAGRTDRSLPVQEEDEVLSRGTGSLSGRTANQWGVSDNGTQPSFEAPSPTPSSDLNPEGNINGQRFDVGSNGHHDDEKVKLTLAQQQQQDEDEHAQYLERRDSTEEDGSYTPRSPSAGLPNDASRQIHYAGQNIPIRVPVPVSLRANKNRNGSTDHLMRGLEGVLLDQQQMDPQQMQQQSSTSSTASHQQIEQTSERPPKYHDQRLQLSQSEQYQLPSPQNYTPTSTTLTTSSSTANNSSTDYNQGLYNHNARYIPQPQVYPDDFQNYPEEYFQAYFTSPGRPDAPIPPTPHSQTAAPSPSPLISGYGGNQDLPTSYRPMRAAGSPYPFPFGHVRRNRPPGPTGGGRNSLLSSGLAMDPNRIARQYQIYAQNAHQGNITDSTLSPSSTPFQPDNMFDQWAYLHTARSLGLGHNAAMRGFSNLETASMLSSPSHEPLPLPNFSGRKKDKKGSNGVYKNRNYDRIRQLPPRVESTQPRETSPELSSGSESGEETAGEERHAFSIPAAQTIPIDPLPFPPVVIVDQTESSDEWIDEDDEDDYEDFLDIEYHPSFVKNVSKRRRKWEVGWENLIQAFQALDRQTDATMVLLASPSHSTKLHALQSRSIRRRPVLAHSQYMKDIRKGFAQISAERRGMRKELASFGDKMFHQSKGDSPSGSEGSSSASLEEFKLKRALRTMAEVYEQREARFVEELQKSREDAELLVRQILGDRSPLINANNVASVTTAPSSGVLSSTSS